MKIVILFFISFLAHSSNAPIFVDCHCFAITANNLHWQFFGDACGQGEDWASAIENAQVQSCALKPAILRDGGALDAKVDCVEKSP